jgi:glycolate oxidase iron-sulfur subunit
VTDVATSSARCALPNTPLADVRGGIDTCVHCGFCLPACPTYLTLQDENDSPRGRIVLMKSVLEGELAADDPSVKTHIDRCLGCRACETACPSGVPYGSMLEATRATFREIVRPAPIVRLILRIFATPWLLAIAMAKGRILRATGLPRLAARIPGRVGFAAAMLASTRESRGPLRALGRAPRDRYPDGGGEELPASATRGERGSFTLLEGCVMAGLFGHVNEATVRVLERNGYTPSKTAGQRCCGALHAHAGDLDGARRLARINIAAFEKSEAEYVVTNSAGCGAIMKEYGHLLAADAKWAGRAERFAGRVRDVSELLAAAGPRDGSIAPVKVAYDAPCHLLHVQRVAEQPLQSLAAARGAELVELDGAEHCCGAAGIYSLIEPETSQAVLEPKLENIRATGADFVATGNPGCLMQIGAGLILSGQKARAVHPVEILDRAYENSSEEG